MSTATLLMNPHADLHVHPEPATLPVDPAAVEVITVRCPVRGGPARVRKLDRSGDPALFGFFAGLVAAGGVAELDSRSPVVPALVDLGFLVTEDLIATPTPYRVPLPEPMDVPEGATVSPHVRFQSEFVPHPAVSWPPEVSGRPRDFARGPACWVGDPAGLPAVYWIDADDVAAVAALEPGGPPPAGPLAGRLAAAGALVPGPAPLERFAAQAPVFDAEGVAVLRDVLPATEVTAAARYYRTRIDAGFMPFGDRQNPDRHSWYADPVGRFLQQRLAAAVAAVTGSPVRPAFSYYFSYVAGARLAPHKDRRQAELSVTLQLDHEPGRSGRPTGWPLRFRFDDGRTAEADLAPGDAVVYQGRTVEHSRDRLPAGRSSVVVLEYVGPGFAGLLV